ncbi:GMP synthase [glutamine-hydrolyzing] [Striga asiatica]|uniref:GMP synthase [glutamine-hydrolyzing] n=1 Tax=Striga asiatica TaxID=4170 RepID=A0A5A7QR73_STRAF|nr:GMP synthase [glutamine-hydrolyzing] [Striga asiatica]
MSRFRISNKTCVVLFAGMGQDCASPTGVLKRHPFPGPGLAVRVPGDVTLGNRLDILRKKRFKRGKRTQHPVHCIYCYLMYLYDEVAAYALSIIKEFAGGSEEVHFVLMYEELLEYPGGGDSAHQSLYFERGCSTGSFIVPHFYGKFLNAPWIFKDKMKILYGRKDVSPTKKETHILLNSNHRLDENDTKREEIFLIKRMEKGRTKKENERKQLDRRNSSSGCMTR